MTAQNGHATYVCVNNGETRVPIEIADQSICINDDIKNVTKNILYWFAVINLHKNLSKWGDRNGRFVILEFREPDAAAFDDMLLFFQQHPDFEKLEIASEPIVAFSG